MKSPWMLSGLAAFGLVCCGQRDKDASPHPANLNGHIDFSISAKEPSATPMPKTAGSAAIASAGADDAAKWSKYQNARFGYSLSYPSTLLRAQREADNGDGRHFKSSNGSMDVAVWAGNVTSDDPLAEAVGYAEDDCANHHASYKVVRKERNPPFMALSCTKKNSAVLYTKAIICSEVATQIQFEYPPSQKSQWDPIVQRMSASLGAGCGLSESP